MNENIWRLLFIYKLQFSKIRLLSSFYIMYLDLQLMSQINIENISFQRKFHFVREIILSIKWAKP
jgi:hypothetical protein